MSSPDFDDVLTEVPVQAAFCGHRGSAGTARRVLHRDQPYDPLSARHVPDRPPRRREHHRHAHRSHRHARRAQRRRRTAARPRRRLPPRHRRHARPALTRRPSNARRAERSRAVDPPVGGEPNRPGPTHDATTPARSIGRAQVEPKQVAGSPATQRVGPKEVGIGDDPGPHRRLPATRRWGQNRLPNDQRWSPSNLPHWGQNNLPRTVGALTPSAA